ncbi:MAG: ATP-binding protein, partial [Sphaerochaetaceae bacterium]
QNLVSLREELDNTKNYFFIQQYRFGPRLSLQVMLADDCEKEAMEIRIPKLTLQPIVENAIIHGLECKLGEGIVRIKIEVMDSRLLITVSDNGVGMEAEQVVALRHALSVKSSEGLAKKEGGIALENVNHRIKLLFGERYGLDITSCIGVGTDVMISLPRSVPKEVVG